ncbi:MAG: alpha/beta hydrolase [Acidobacteriaceae bacterium]|nr:alpha/beta hydrolase [Acidobacteriaceae bacterium]
MNLVLLPGMHGSSELYADFVAALPTSAETRVLSYPNDTLLSNSELLETIRSFVPRTEPYVLLAESFSTPLAIQFAAANPPNLSGLILCAGFATSPLRGVTRLLGRYLAPALPFVPAGVAGAIMVSGSHAPGSILSRLRNAINSVRPSVLVNRVHCVLGCDVLDDLRRINVPVLYMHAAHDRLVNPVCLEEMRRVKPDIEVAVLNGAHVLLQLMPRQSAEVVASFARRLS